MNLKVHEGSKEPKGSSSMRSKPFCMNVMMFTHTKRIVKRQSFLCSSCIFARIVY